MDKAAVANALRAAVEDAIEALLHFLDTLNGEADFEEAEPPEDSGDCEPSLGWTLWGSPSPNPQLGETDLELEHDGLEPDAGL
jgi:hypothetical protein